MVSTTASYSYSTQALINHIKTLSSDAFEGRRTGTAGALKAKQYIIEDKDKEMKDSITQFIERVLSPEVRKEYFEFAIELLASDLKETAKTEGYEVERIKQDE